jgi:hypothetical protein
VLENEEREVGTAEDKRLEVVCGGMTVGVVE